MEYMSPRADPQSNPLDARADRIRAGCGCTDVRGEAPVLCPTNADLLALTTSIVPFPPAAPDRGFRRGVDPRLDAGSSCDCFLKQPLYRYPSMYIASKISSGSR